MNFLFLAFAQRIALPALPRGPGEAVQPENGRRGKLLGMCAESPASGTLFFGWRLFCSNALFVSKTYH
jgi:hypothetical protein